MSRAPFSLHRGKKPKGGGLPMHRHEEAQLTFAVSGLIQLYTVEGKWLVPPQLAAWIPVGVDHHVEFLSDAEIWMVQWDPEAISEWVPHLTLDRAFALHISPLLRSLLNAAFAPDTAAEKAKLIVQLILHELDATANAPTFLPLPTSAIGQRCSDIALADTQNLLTVVEIASKAATSIRTLSRLFPMETALTFKAWRQRARIVQSMERLAQGHSIAKVARETGFSSTAAFAHAFRQVTSVAPSAFLPRALG